MDGFFDMLIRAIGTGALIPALLFWFSRNVDEDLTPSFRTRFAEFLLSNRPTSLDDNFRYYFVGVYDSIFGVKALSWKYISRSFTASLLAVTAMFLVWLSVNYTSIGYVNSIDLNSLDIPEPISAKEMELYFNLPNLRDFETIGLTFVATLLLACILNLLPDYLSMVQSRVIIGRMTGTTFSNCLVYFALDFVITTAIVLAYLILWLSVMIDSLDHLGRLLLEVVYGGIALNAKGQWGAYSIFGVFIYSTYLTSVWLWLYSVSVLILRTRGSLRLFRNVLLIRERPFRCIGLVIFLPSIAISIVLSWLL